jgi:hypothetical protein
MVNDILYVVKITGSDFMAIFDDRNICINFIVNEFGNDELSADASIVEFEDWCIETDRYNPETDGEFEDFFDFDIFEIFMRAELEKDINYFDDCCCFNVEVFSRDETGAFT